MSNNNQIILSFRDIIENRLLPLVGDKCVLFDVPFYKNVGDLLIWEGTLTFLSSNHIELLDFADYHTYFKKTIPENVTILFQGGGNIGDLYHEHVELLLRLIHDYPHHRIVVLSQTIYYNSEKSFEKDFDVISSHPYLFFAARDENTFHLIENRLGNRAFLLPDMAFYVNSSIFKTCLDNSFMNELYIKRHDRESINMVLKKGYDYVGDWPTFEREFSVPVILNTLFDRVYRFIPPVRPFIRDCWKNFASVRFRYSVICCGVKFISPYKKVYSERLHGVILAILLGKDVVVVDNSYGKNSNFYNTWLKDFENVELQYEQ